MYSFLKYVEISTCLQLLSQSQNCNLNLLIWLGKPIFAKRWAEPARMCCSFSLSLYSLDVKRWMWAPFNPSLKTLTPLCKTVVKIKDNNDSSAVLLLFRLISDWRQIDFLKMGKSYYRTIIGFSTFKTFTWHDVLPHWVANETGTRALGWVVHRHGNRLPWLKCTYPQFLLLQAEPSTHHLSKLGYLCFALKTCSWPSPMPTKFITKHKPIHRPCDNVPIIHVGKMWKDVAHSMPLSNILVCIHESYKL